MSINYKEINNELVNAFKDKQDVTLYMLGENNLKYLKDETYREFFLNVFKNSNVKTIYFCYKIPNPRPSVKWDIENFVVEKDKNDTNELCAFLTLISIPWILLQNNLIYIKNIQINIKDSKLFMKLLIL